MDITLTMLLHLAFPADAVRISGRSARFSAEAISGPEKVQPAVHGIRLLTNIREAGAGANKNILLLKGQKNDILLCHGDEKILLQTGIKFAKAFNRLVETFIALRDWDMQLHEGILENKGLQYMIDVSEDIFRRPMTLTTPGYKLVAYARNARNGDRIFQESIEKGYISAESVAYFDRCGYIFENRGIRYRRGFPEYSLPMLNGTVMAGTKFSYMLTMSFPSDDCSDGVVELFAHLQNRLQQYVEKNGDAAHEQTPAWMSLIVDLIEGKCNAADFAERNRYSGLSESEKKGSWRLVSVGKPDGMMSEFMQNRLEHALRGQRVFVCAGSVYVLLSDDSLLDQIIAVAREAGMLVGISPQFYTLFDLRRAYMMAGSVIQIGLLVSQNRTLERLGITQKTYDTAVFWYSDYYPYFMILGGGANSGLPTGTEATNAAVFPTGFGPADKNLLLAPKFMRLLDEDRKTGAGNLRLLYAYLKSDCSKTKTAAELFMHRNNVIYRLDKLEENLGVSIADEHIKTSFRLSFLALELFARV